MSGSSLDGLDIAGVEFWEKGDEWGFEIIEFKTVPFSEKLTSALEKCRELDSLSLQRLDLELGRWVGETIQKNIAHLDSYECIGSHGHTVFHNPAQKTSLQIGSGSEIANITGIKTITNFRHPDVVQGGQGAPLVPIGDYYLFPDFDGFLNLGGIANLSFCSKNEMIAFDAVPANQVLNAYAKQLGFSYDDKGKIARANVVDSDYLKQLHSIDYFEKLPPKSISNEWVEEYFLNRMISDPQKGLKTYSTFIADVLATEINRRTPKRVLCTGGGAYNRFIIEELQSRIECDLVVPKKTLIEGKEALVFAFMAVLKSLERVNIMSSVTGATKDTSAGTIYMPEHRKIN